MLSSRHPPPMPPSRTHDTEVTHILKGPLNSALRTELQRDNDKPTTTTQATPGPRLGSECLRAHALGPRFAGGLRPWEESGLSHQGEQDGDERVPKVDSRPGQRPPGNPSQGYQ